MLAVLPKCTYLCSQNSVPVCTALLAIILGAESFDPGKVCYYVQYIAYHMVCVCVCVLVCCNQLVSFKLIAICMVGVISIAFESTATDWLCETATVGDISL